MLQQPKDQQPDYSHSARNKAIGIGGVIAAIATLLTAFINYGGIQFIESHWRSSPAAQSPNSTQNPESSADPPIATQPAPSPIAPPAPQSLPSTPMTSNPASAQSETSVEANGFLFQLQDCSRDHKTVICTLLITSQDSDRGLGIYRQYQNSTRMIDSDGNEYITQGLRLGSDVNEERVGSNLAAGVPLKARVSFGEVPENVQKIALLELAARSNYKEFNPQFHAVVIQNN